MDDQQTPASRLAALEEAVRLEPGVAGFPAVAEMHRRAGEFDLAERIVRAGLDVQPDCAEGEQAKDGTLQGCDFMTMVRNREWKLVHFLDQSDGQLFDLTNDPDEVNNLWDAKEHEAKKNELLAVLCLPLYRDDRLRLASGLLGQIFRPSLSELVNGFKLQRVRLLLPEQGYFANYAVHAQRPDLIGVAVRVLDSQLCRARLHQE